MKYEVRSATEVLQRTPFVLEALLSGLGDEWIHNNEGAGTWSPFRVVGHLIVNEETNFLQRAQIIVTHQEPQTLSTISMTAHLERYGFTSIDTLLKTFKELRKRNLEALKSLSIADEDLTKQALHPAVGVVELSHVLSTWVAHDLIHIGQITRVMAKQYKSEVGPFIKYLARLQ